MAKNQSAGILLHRFHNKIPEILLVHPGGPFWKNKDDGVWSIPKGEFNDEEEPLAAAQREFTEETGAVLSGVFIPLDPVMLKSGKKVYAWALEGDLDTNKIISNDFEIEWPPKSGKLQSFPEIDKAGWFTINEAKKKINPAQSSLIDDLLKKINYSL